MHPYPHPAPVPWWWWWVGGVWKGKKRNRERKDSEYGSAVSVSVSSAHGHGLVFVSGKGNEDVSLVGVEVMDEQYEQTSSDSDFLAKMSCAKLSQHNDEMREQMFLRCNCRTLVTLCKCEKCLSHKRGRNVNTDW